MDYKEKVIALLKSQELSKEQKEKLEFIFPEITESDDERIRKALMQNLKERFGTEGNMGEGLDMPDVLAWFEKQGKITKEWSEIKINNIQTELQEMVDLKQKTEQGEQKPVYIIEPKFKVGDKIKLAGEPKYPAREIIAIKNDAYYFDELVHLPFTDQDNWELVEQKPANKTEPKFKVGDSISKKHNSDINKFGIFTITSIADNKYWYNDSVICDFSDQDLWEFVERSWFKKGDWVFHNTAEFIYMIQTIGRDGYGVISRDGKKSVVYYSAEINYRLWTIQDAKDGDVLISSFNRPFIFKEVVWDEFGRVCCAYGGINGSDKFFVNTHSKSFWTDSDGVKPATNEQNDLLFQKMKEAGYEWDAEKKELKKIEHKPADNIESSAFKDKLLELFQKFRYIKEGVPTNGDIIDYVDSHIQELIDTVQNKPWSEDDEKMLNQVIEDFVKLAGPYVCYHKDVDWLKSLKDRCLPAKQEWSEEDEEILDTIVRELEEVKKTLAEISYPAYDRIISWLKSLRPQNRWKPSDEQMKLLREVQQALLGKDCHNRFVDFMYELKRLREE